MKNEEIAKEVGVHRVTLSNWRLHHPGFQAALNARRVAVWSGSQDRMRALLGQAMDVVKEDLQSPSPGRSKLALEVLKLGGIGSENFGVIGPTDPEVIVEGVSKANRERERSAWRPSEEERSTTADLLLERANEPPPLDADPEVPENPLAKSRDTED